MVKLKKNNNQWLYVIAIITVLLLLKLNPGMLAFITTCDNNEPLSMASWNNYMNLTNSTTIIQEPTIYLEGNETTLYETTTIINEQLTITIIDSTKGCEQLINQLKTGENSSTINFNKHEITIINEEQYWCNKNERLTLNAESITSVSDYYSLFEVCTTTEINESQEEQVANIITPPLVNETSTPTEDETFNISGTTTIDRTTLIITIIIGLLIVYFVYEAGPKKGLIKR